MTLLFTVHLWPNRMVTLAFPQTSLLARPPFVVWDIGVQKVFRPTGPFGVPLPRALHILFPLLGSLSHILLLWPTPTYPIGPLWERSLPPESLLWLFPRSWGICVMWFPSSLDLHYHHSYQSSRLLLVLLSGISTQTWGPRRQSMCLFLFMASWSPTHLTCQGDLTVVDWIHEHMLN